MCNILLRKLVGFVTVYLALAGLIGCSDNSSDTGSLPSQGGSAGQAGGAGSSIGGNAGATANGGSGGVKDAGLGGGGSSGTGGSAGTSTGGSAGQAGGDAGDDASSDAEDDVSNDGNPGIICPSCDELLTWDTTQFKHSTYGKLSTSATWDDSYAWQMLNTCTGWGIVDGHEGGTGDTLEIGTCNGGVVLVWAYDMFSSVRLAQGWTGKTDTSLGIGTSYQAFLQTYPDYTSGSMLLDANGYALLNYANGMAVFKDSALSELTVW